MRRIRVARCSCCSTATARQVGWLRIHSTATEPAPAPDVPEQRARAGAARCGERRGAQVPLGQLAVVVVGGVRQPRGQRGGRRRGPGDALHARRRASAGPAPRPVGGHDVDPALVGRRRGRRARSACWRRSRPRPAAPATSAGRARVAGQHQHPAARVELAAGPGRRRRPRSRTTAYVSAAQPSRAAARATDETAGCTRTASAPSRSTSVEPIPASSGSPLASTTTRAAPRARRRARAARRSRSARPGVPLLAGRPSGSRSRWRGPPSTRAAASTSARSAAPSESQPAAPIPTTSITRRP